MEPSTALGSVQPEGLPSRAPSSSGRALPGVLGRSGLVQVTGRSGSPWWGGGFTSAVPWALLLLDQTRPPGLQLPSQQG